MTTEATLAALLTKARQRSISHTLLHVLTWALVAVLACAAVILIAGSEFLSWWLLPAAVVLSLAVGLWIAGKHFPTPYEIAQKIDTRLHLADTLSTACHFSHTNTSEDEAIRDAQRQRAETLVPSVDLKTALPLARPRALYPAMALFLLVAGLFAVRYAVQGSFDPRPSLVKNAIDNFFAGAKQQALLAKSPNGEDSGDKTGDKAEQKNADFAGDSQFDPAAPEPQPAPDADKADSGKKADEKSDAKGGDKGDDKGADKQNNEKQDGNQNGSQDTQNDANQNAKSDPSVMDKLKDAVNDLINKMKSPSKNDSKNQKGEPKNADKQQSDPNNDGQNSDKNQGDSADAEKSAQQSSDGESGKNSSQKKKSDSPQQGVGSQDGDKSAKEAAAQKAMGKITELLGKRSENVKGTVTMEVGQTKQTLKTATSESAATHAEAGGEIHRDTVPPAYEQFVQQYFEQVRKADSTRTPTSPAPVSK